VITITILKISQIPGDTELNLPPTQAADFAIRNDAIAPTWYRWSRGGITQGADVQTFLDAEGASLYSEAVANSALTMTQGQVNAGDFAWKHWANKDTFATAQYTYSVGMLGGAATLAAYRIVLTNALTELAPLSGSQFDTEFTNERVALGVNIAIGGMTLAQCQAFATLLDRWLSARRVDVLWAGSIVGLA
jgi:hypothetical protein